MQKYGASPKSVGYLVSTWAKFERDAVHRYLHNLRGTLLDVGCGIGFISAALSSQFRVVGLDISEELLKFCPRSGFLPIAGSAFRLPFRDDTFDMILCTNVLQQFDYESGVGLFRELVRVANLDGGILMTVRNGNSLVRHLSEPIFQLLNIACLTDGLPLFGYEAKTISQEMALLGCKEEFVGYLFPPFRLQMGQYGRYLGTTTLLTYRKMEDLRFEN